MNHQQNSYAIIVGVSNYEDVFTSLPNARNDALELTKILIDVAGFSPERTYLLAEQADPVRGVRPLQPTRALIYDVVQRVAKEVDEDSFILFYFGGHGAEMSSIPYLMASDTRLNVVDKTAIKVSDLNEILESSRASCILRLFDACRSSLTEGRDFSPGMTAAFEEAMMYKAKGWATFSACSSNEVAHEANEYGHGIFSYWLCEGLRGDVPSDDGMVTLERLVDYVKINVAQWCKQRMARQTPHLLSDISGTLVLSQTKPSVQAPILPLNRPFTLFHQKLDSILVNSAPDVRNFTFTSTDELLSFFDLIFQHLDTENQNFSHPAMTTTLVTSENIEKLGHGGAFERLKGSWQENRVAEEFRECRAIKCTFSSQVVEIPTTNLFIVAARFHFFYWMWWCHICNPDQLQNRFVPNPQIKAGFVTFMPSGVTNKYQVIASLDSILEQSYESTAQWAAQLNAVLERKLDPVRKMPNVIS